MLTNVNTTTDVSIQKDASTKLVIFFVFVKMDGLANFAIRVSFSKFSKISKILEGMKFLDIELIDLFRHKRV